VTTPTPEQFASARGRVTAAETALGAARAAVPHDQAAEDAAAREKTAADSALASLGAQPYPSPTYPASQATAPTADEAAAADKAATLEAARERVRQANVGIDTAVQQAGGKEPAVVEALKEKEDADAALAALTPDPHPGQAPGVVAEDAKPIEAERPPLR
jgi:hypothetical protein